MRRVGDLCNVRLLGLSSATSALSAFHKFGSGSEKGRSQWGVRGERSEIKPRLTGPIKRRVERPARSLEKSRRSCAEVKDVAQESGVGLEPGVCSQ